MTDLEWQALSNELEGCNRDLFDLSNIIEMYEAFLRTHTINGQSAWDFTALAITSCSHKRNALATLLTFNPVKGEDVALELAALAKDFGEQHAKLLGPVIIHSQHELRLAMSEQRAKANATRAEKLTDTPLLFPWDDQALDAIKSLLNDAPTPLMN